MAPPEYDIAVLGAGHNGLTCAAYLAGAGLRVVVLEKNPVVGGAAVTEEFFPGFRNSVAAYTVSLLNPAVIADLELAKFGLKIVERPVANFWPVDAARALLLPYGQANRQAAIAPTRPRWNGPQATCVSSRSRVRPMRAEDGAKFSPTPASVVGFTA
jgi:phytoene dehydrogenase-like protein